MVKEKRVDFYSSVMDGGLNNIPQAIKRMRTLANLTQEQYAKMVNIDLTTLRKIEQGKANPTVDILEKIGKPFRLKVGFTLNDTEKDLLRVKKNE